MMKSCRTHHFGSVSSIFPDSFSYFRGVRQPADFAGSPCTFHRREFEDISTRKARQFHTASIREKYIRVVVYVYKFR